MGIQYDATWLDQDFSFASDMARTGPVLHRLFVEPNYDSFIQLHVIFEFGVLTSF